MRLHGCVDNPSAPGQVTDAKRRRRRGLQLESAWKLDDEMLEFPAAHDLIQVVWPSRLEIPGREVGPEGCEEAPSIQPKFDGLDEGEIGPGRCEEIPSVQTEIWRCGRGRGHWHKLVSESKSENQKVPSQYSMYDNS